MVLLASLACAEDPPVACADGFEARLDGLCYERIVGDDGDPPIVPPDPVEPVPPADEVLAALAPCTATGTGNGLLDLTTGCAAGVCAGATTYDGFVAALGLPTECEPVAFTFYDSTYGDVSCRWAQGVSASFEDEDLDEEADPESVPFSLDVDTAYVGTTAEGYGLGSELSCFADHDAPTGVATAEVDGAWVVTRISFDGYSVLDEGVALGAAPVGLAGELTMDPP